MNKKNKEITMSEKEGNSTAEKINDDDNDKKNNNHQLTFPPSSSADPKTSQRFQQHQHTSIRRKRKASLLEHSRKEYTFVVGMGMLMAFIAGYSNAVCISGNIHVASSTNEVNQSVTGVTGFYTNSAISLAKGEDWDAFWRQVFTILSVCGGACLSSLFNPYPIAFSLCPRYGIAFLIGGIFTTLGGISHLHNDRREFYFTALGNGIMNGISSMYTSNLIRTTHLTGTTTDIGLFVGQWLCGNYVNVWKLCILLGLTLSFWIGSLIGYYLGLWEKDQSLIMNTLFFYFFGFAIILYNYCSHPEMTWCDAIFGVGFCTTSNFHDSDEFHEYKHGCIEPRGIFRYFCGNGVWCCKPHLEEDEDEEEKDENKKEEKVGRKIDHDRNDDVPVVGGMELNHQMIESNNNTTAASTTAVVKTNNNTADDIEESGCLLSESKEEHDDHLVSKEELIELFHQLDNRDENGGDGYVDTQELAMKLLELRYHHHHHHHQQQHSHRSIGFFSTSSRQSHHHHHHDSVRSCALKSIDALRIANIREIELTGHHHVGR